MDRNPVGFDANDKQWTNFNQISAPESLTQMRDELETNYIPHSIGPVYQGQPKTVFIKCVFKLSFV